MSWDRGNADTIHVTAETIVFTHHPSRITHHFYGVDCVDGGSLRGAGGGRLVFPEHGREAERSVGAVPGGRGGGTPFLPAERHPLGEVDRDPQSRRRQLSRYHRRRRRRP